MSNIHQSCSGTNTLHQPIEQPRTLKSIIQTLKSQTSTTYSDQLIRVLESEERLWKIKVIDLNMYIRYATLDAEEVKVIKDQKRKIRKKMNKRIADHKKRESRADVEDMRAEKRELEAVKMTLLREIEEYRLAMRRSE